MNYPPNLSRFLNRKRMRANPRLYARVLRSALFAGILK